MASQLDWRLLDGAATYRMVRWYRYVGSCPTQKSCSLDRGFPARLALTRWGCHLSYGTVVPVRRKLPHPKKLLFRSWLPSSTGAYSMGCHLSYGTVVPVPYRYRRYILSIFPARHAAIGTPQRSHSVLLIRIRASDPHRTVLPALIAAFATSVVIPRGAASALDAASGARKNAVEARRRRRRTNEKE